MYFLSLIDWRKKRVTQEHYIREGLKWNLSSRFHEQAFHVQNKKKKKQPIVEKISQHVQDNL